MPNVANDVTPHIVSLTFLGIDFSVAAPAVWRNTLLDGPHDAFRYVVTPNVDHVVKINGDHDIARLYGGAAWRICDSRILNRLARARGMDLAPYPGSSLVADMLEDPRSRALRIGILGPTDDQFGKLVARYPSHSFVHIPAPMFRRGDTAWENTLRAAEDAQADVLLLCISFPKQEYFAQDLQTRGKARGTALCVGASIDFLTGEQKRAPVIVQKMNMEWAWRLLGNPRRLWRRYLVEGPKIFRIWWLDRSRSE